MTLSGTPVSLSMRRTGLPLPYGGVSTVLIPHPPSVLSTRPVTVLRIPDFVPLPFKGFPFNTTVMVFHPLTYDSTVFVIGDIHLFLSHYFLLNTELGNLFKRMIEPRILYGSRYKSFTHFLT